MKKYDVALALAIDGDENRIAFARLLLDMMELNELREELKYDGSFNSLRNMEESDYFKLMEIDPRERIKNIEEEFKLKNYDVALALASSGKIEDARKVMEKTNFKNDLNSLDFIPIEREVMKKAEEIKNINDLHNRLFAYLKEKNYPCPDIPQEEKSYYREVAVGWISLGIVPPFAHVTREELNSWLRADLSREYGFMRPSGLKYIDYMCETPEEIWIIEGKSKLDFKAIGQVLTYSFLFSQDYPTQKPIRKAIVCEEIDHLLKNACEGNGIEVMAF
ncbi:MAG: hypothetical protein J7K95_01260 [Thermoplasmata archaeon]|nr:hypothetical protein [Thermoplasmata archaeon]